MFTFVPIMKLSIGIPHSYWAEEYVSTAQPTLMEHSVDCDWLAVGNRNEHFTTILAKLELALQSGEIDAFIFPHKSLPTTPGKAMVITASGPRSKTGDLLFIHPHSYDTKAIFKLKRNAKVNVANAMQEIQMRDYRPDVEVYLMPDTMASFDLLLKEGTDAVITSGDELIPNLIKASDIQIIELNPREFVPAPAQGVWAWLCNQGDVHTRRALRSIHHTEVSNLTNVERSVLRHYNDDPLLAVYCERDLNGFVHAFAARFAHQALTRARISSSTTFGLSDALIKQLG